MNKLNKITKETKIGIELGYEEEHIAKNVVAIFKLNKEHLHYDPTTYMYDWEQE